jgi:hypothetical protein
MKEFFEQETKINQKYSTETKTTAIKSTARQQ